jgi:hypothetical protein
MKPAQTSSKVLPLLAFGAHPDDVEFGCGGVVLNETRAYIELQLTRARLLGRAHGRRLCDGSLSQ